jgi:hypothetical protein
MVLTADLATALDPVLLARAAGLIPDLWQADILRARSRRTLLNVTRQGGKSTIAALLATHDALFLPDSLTLLLSPSLRQSGELFQKVLRIYKAVGRPVHARAETALSLTLANGARIVALPGTEATIRGYSGVTRLIVDEAARVLDDLYFSVRPMLAVSGGNLLAMSTPFGKRGWWHQAWTEGGDTWERIAIPATACPRISPAFLAEEQRALGAWWYQQEYCNAFMDTVDAVFRSDDIQRALTHEVIPLFSGGIMDPMPPGDTAPAATAGAPVVVALSG